MYTRRVHTDVADKTIRVSEETWRALRSRKREGESFDDVIRRLQADKWRGFGALADTGVAAGMRRVHEDLEAALEDDIESMDR